eukprot:5018745-Prymnesium_polylepis.1
MRCIVSCDVNSPQRWASKLQDDFGCAGPDQKRWRPPQDDNRRRPGEDVDEDGHRARAHGRRRRRAAGRPRCRGAD